MVVRAKRLSKPFQYRRRRSLEERDQLVLQYQYLPKWVVNRMRNSAEVKRFGFSDCESKAMLGLIRAADLWDEKKGVKFITYATRACFNAVSSGADTLQTHFEFSLLNYDMAIPIGEESRMNSRSDSRKDFENKDLIDGLMAELDATERRAVELRYYAGYCLDQVADALGLGKETVRRLVRGALIKMRTIAG